MSDTILTVIISGLGSIIVAFIINAVAWKKAPAEAEDLHADAAAKYQKIANEAADKAMARMQKQIEELQQQVDELKRQLTLWGCGIKILVEQLESHDITPVWTPDQSRVIREEIKQHSKERANDNSGD